MTTPTYDRELANLLRAADNADAAGVRTVNATGPVRALAGVAEQLRRAGASLPAPEVKGTPESGVTTGLSIALALVESALAQQPEAPAKQVVAPVGAGVWTDHEIHGDTMRCAISALERAGLGVLAGQLGLARDFYTAPQPAIPEGWSFVRQDDGSIVARAEGYGAACVRENDHTSAAAGLLYLLAADLLAQATQETDHG